MAIRAGKVLVLNRFHNVVLGNDLMPLDILEQVVQDYKDAKLASL
jgi:uncharacterized protein (DUF885 family)